MASRIPVHDFCRDLAISLQSHGNPCPCESHSYRGRLVSGSLPFLREASLYISEHGLRLVLRHGVVGALDNDIPSLVLK